MRKATVISLLSGIMEKQNEAVKEKKFATYEEAKQAEREDFYRCGVRDALRQAILLIQGIEESDD